MLVLVAAGFLVPGPLDHDRVVAGAENARFPGLLLIQHGGAVEVDGHRGAAIHRDLGDAVGRAFLGYPGQRVPLNVAVTFLPDVLAYR